MHTGQLEQWRADAPGSVPLPRTDGESVDDYPNCLTHELDPLHCPPEFPAGWIPFAHHGVQLITSSHSLSYCPTPLLVFPGITFQTNDFYSYQLQSEAQDRMMDFHLDQMCVLLN